MQPRRYAGTVVPIAIGHTTAHYFSLCVLDGQTTWILASNPSGLAGVDLTAVDSDAIAPCRWAPWSPATWWG